jgi:hypothetical protein
MTPRTVTPQQSAVLADLALTMLQAHPGTKNATLGTLIAGRMNDLEPQDFRDTMANLVRFASGTSLDVIGELFEVTRGITIHCQGQSPETDNSFSETLRGRLRRPEPPGAGEQLVGISLRAVLHFAPITTTAKQNAVIREAVQDVEKSILGKEVGETFRVNDVWMTLRERYHVIDIGEPNRPLEEILLWRGAAGETRRGQDLTTNYILQCGERLVVEPSMPTPIDVRPGRP